MQYWGPYCKFGGHELQQSSQPLYCTRWHVQLKVCWEMFATTKNRNPWCVEICLDRRIDAESTCNDSQSWIVLLPIYLGRKESLKFTIIMPPLSWHLAGLQVSAVWSVQVNMTNIYVTPLRDWWWRVILGLKKRDTFLSQQLLFNPQDIFMGYRTSAS